MNQIHSLIGLFTNLNVQYEIINANFRYYFSKSWPKAIIYSQNEIQESLISKIKNQYPSSIIGAYVTTSGNTIFLIDGDPLTHQL